ncbi:MAG: hypothetical protein HYR56_30710 [Acidobacteria bacterium]|nr:hypothetical protein [Acidobacteriota bacterium]
MSLLLGWLVVGRVALLSVRAAVLCVNPAGTGGCFATIGAAVAAAVAGDTINVAAGTYNEQVNLNKANLVLRGGQAGVPACGRAGGANESVVTHPNGAVQLNADGVTLDGFTIQGTTGGANAGVICAASTSGQRVLNNIIQNNVIGLYLNSNVAGNALVQGNRFRNNNNAGSASGNGIYSDGELHNTTLRQNCFTGHPTASIQITGVTARNPDKFSGLTITDNSAAGERFLELVFAKNVTISNNRATDAPALTGSGSPGVAISIGGGNVGVTLEGNAITNALAAGQNTAPAILVRNRAQAVNADVSVRCNRFVGNAGGGLVVQADAYTGTVVAENNWWGCNAGPGGQGCDATTGNVDANPWLVMGLTVPSLGARNGQTPLSASFLRNSAGAAVTCTFAENTPVSFSSTCGTPNPATAFTLKGEAKATLAPTGLGSCTVTATADKQSLSSALTVLESPQVTLMPLEAGCIGPGIRILVEVQFTNTSDAPQALSMVTTVSSVLSITVGCSAFNGTCAFEPHSVMYSATLAPGQRGSYAFIAEIGVGAGTGEDLPVTTTLSLGGSTATVVKLLRVTCPDLIPGFPLDLSAAAATAQRPGSVLIYSIYTSSASAANTQNTRLSLTNTNTTSAATVHLFFVARDNCQVSDAFVCLTAKQTVSFQAADLDPGTTGFLVAVAVDDVTGCPIQFNHLIGDEFVKFTSGHQANLGAEAIAALSPQPALCTGGQPQAQLRFNGVNYGMLPGTVALDSVPSRADNNNSLWFLVRLDGNLATGAFAPATLNGTLYDDSEAAYSIGNYNISCQLSGPLLASALVGGKRFESVVPSGRTGWLKLNLAGTTPRGLLGAQLNFNPNTRSSSSAYSQGHLLHKLTLTNSTVLTIPVIPPTC